MAAAALFQELGKHVSAEIVNKVKGVYLFKITGGDSWTVDLKNGTGSVKQGQEGTPDCTITISDEDFVNLITGKANGQQLFMGGKIKIAGNMALAMKLEVLKQMAPKGGVTPSAANGSESFKSDVIFPELAKRFLLLQLLSSFHILLTILKNRRRSFCYQQNWRSLSLCYCRTQWSQKELDC